MVVRSELWILIVAQLSDMAPESGVFLVGWGGGGWRRRRVGNKKQAQFEQTIEDLNFS